MEMLKVWVSNWEKQLSMAVSKIPITKLVSAFFRSYCSCPLLDFSKNFRALQEGENP
jgi:hypothetical protein